MRRILPLICSLAFTAGAFAVAPQFWRVEAVDEFLAGEIEGLAVTSRGELRLAPAVRKIAAFDDPFVLSQAAAPGGDRFFGTGNDGKVYRLRGTTLTLLFTAPEPEIYAVAYANGALYAASSPNGKVYRIDPDSGKGAPFYDPGQAYIWSLVPLATGELAVGTGVEGKLFRVNARGEGTVLYDAPDTHIRTLLVRRDGSLLAGASGKGRIYSIGRDGSAIALFESPLNEISTLHVDRAGTAWAAAVTNVLPSAAPPKQQGAPQQQQQGQSSAEAKKEDQGDVQVTFSFEEPQASSAPSGASEVYRIHGDGFVETVRKFEREMVYAISDGATGVLLATGPTGRIYELNEGELALVGSVPEKQIVSMSHEGGRVMITTTNTGAVYQMVDGRAENAEFRSAAKDVERFSRFGSYRIDGRNLSDGTVAISFRSGNTRTPDETWSAWSAPRTTLEGSVPSPAARFLQWKLQMTKVPAGAAVNRVTVAYMNRNLAPQIEALAVQEPAVVFINPGFPSAPQVVEATNPDEYGIFSTLESARERGAEGKRAFRKGYRTVVWRAIDENGDRLRYTLSFRQKGTERWLRLRDGLEDTQYGFDSSQLPNGLYEVRLVATDALDNPDGPLSDSHDGVEFLVDNEAPRITTTREGDSVTVRITDALSPVGKVEYSVDAEQWLRAIPLDGIADSSEETYRLPLSEISGRYVIVRAVDAHYNVATESVSVR